uniref:Uncharacterized protein n=1 Tax=Romanomermis culicivorax TaxID=13658 RepID=A0A915J4B0_ROMCU
MIEKITMENEQEVVIRTELILLMSGEMASDDKKNKPVKLFVRVHFGHNANTTSQPRKQRANFLKKRSAKSTFAGVVHITFHSIVRLSNYNI